MNQKKIIIILTVLVLLLAGMITYLLASRSSIRSTSPENPENSPSTFEGRDPSAEREAVNWVAYAGPKLNAEFRYPRDWEIRTPEGYDAQGKLWSMEIGKVLCCQLEFGNGMSLQITHYRNDDSKCIEADDVLERAKESYGPDFTKEKFTYGGFYGSKVETNPNNKEITREEHVDLYQKKDGRCYFLSWSAVDPGERGFKYTTYLTPILDSFIIKPIESKDKVIRELLGEKHKVEIKSLVIEKEDEEHMRGQVEFIPSQDDIENGVGRGSSGIFLAAKMNGKWVLAFDGNGEINCLDIRPYKFPPSMVPECAI